MTVQPTFPTLLQRYFTQRPVQQRQASAHTIASYRDTFRLLLQFAQRRLRRAPSALALEDIDAPLVVEFLDELEKTRDVTARTRNLRLTAIRSFFRYVAFEAPAHAAQIQRLLAIPAKRYARALVPSLSRPEVDALLTAPDQRTWSGRRDHALILLAVQTGLAIRRFTTIEHGLTLHKYWSSACPRCAIKAQCTTREYRRIARWEHEDVLDVMQRRLDRTPQASRIRRQTAEHPFGTIKAWMGATHFLTKTIPRVSTEMSLHVLAYNMKRAMQILGIAPLMAALRA